MKILPSVIFQFLLLFCLSGGASLFADDATYKKYYSKDGKLITAKLVSHRGDGKVKVETKDGKSHEIPVTAFSELDQELIGAWLEKTPIFTEYFFSIDAKPVLTDEESNNIEFKTLKWRSGFYKLTVKNMSKDVVSGLKFQYRAFLWNEVNGYYPDHSPSLKVFFDEIEQKSPLRTGESIEIETPPMRVETVQWLYGKKELRVDKLSGFMIRALDRSGDVVWEHKSNDPRISLQTWGGDGKKKEDDKNEDGRLE